MSGDESGIPRFPFTEINKEEYSPDEFVNTMSRYLLREFSYEKLEDHSHEALDRKADELYKYLHFVYSSFVHKNYVMADEMELARTIHEDAPYLYPPMTEAQENQMEAVCDEIVANFADVRCDQNQRRVERWLNILPDVIINIGA